MLSLYTCNLRSVPCAADYLVAQIMYEQTKKLLEI